jgi:hypothetical protein
MTFKFVKRSAAGYPSLGADMPVARPMPIQAGAPRDAATPAHIALQRLQQQNALLKNALAKVAADRARVVKEANTKLGALVTRNRQLEGLVRTAYSPGVQAPGRGPVSVGVPTHALENPNVQYVDGGRGAPAAVPFNPAAGNPHDAAGSPRDAAHPVHETVRAAEDAIFYGEGDAAFYSGGENDD